MLRSFLNKDKDDFVEYKKEIKFLTEMIKKLFSPSTLKKQVILIFNKGKKNHNFIKAQLIEKGEIKNDHLMEGWTDESLRINLDQVISLYK